MSLPEHVKQAAIAAVNTTPRDEYIDQQIAHDVKNGFKRKIGDAAQFPTDAAKVTEAAKKISRDTEYLKLEAAEAKEGLGAATPSKLRDTRDARANVIMKELGVTDADVIFVRRALNFSGQNVLLDKQLEKARSDAQERSAKEGNQR